MSGAETKHPKDPEAVKARAEALLARYKPLIGDWDAFLDVLIRPKPTCIVANAGRLDRDRLADLLAEGPAELTPVPWDPAALRVPADARPGTWWAFLAGLYQVQEEASLLPTAMLDPQPGERVLDLCAAPGGKAARIAMAVGPAGTVIANEKEPRRLSAVRDKMKRLGLVNLTSTVHDGGDYPLEAGPFDRVLVDAPCTSEGTKFRQGAGYQGSEPEFLSWIAGQQAALLRRAAQLVKPGGRVVYATCSFAPEENEAVVDRVLGELDGALTPVAVRPPGLEPGRPVESWGGRTFAEDVQAGIRLWPHTHGTGGFFAIAFDKPADAPAPAAEPTRHVDGWSGDPQTWIGPVLDKFDLAGAPLAGLRVIERGDDLQLVSERHDAPARPAPVSTGVPARRSRNRTPKPSTALALLVGQQARARVVEVTAEQRDAYQRRQPIQPSAAQLAACGPDAHVTDGGGDGAPAPRQGFVLLRYRGIPLGVGFLRPGPPAEIESQFPRAWKL
jgi:16S rRNA C967 or C1407 C5-methylase (RsmB/RsmF family)